MDTTRYESCTPAENIFANLSVDTFGAEKADYLCPQYHFYDIYQGSRYADFMVEAGDRKVAIEIDDETSHNKQLVSSCKFYDDLLKQNSMVHLGWDVYRWAVRQLQKQPERVKNELRVFLGTHPRFQEIEDYLVNWIKRSLRSKQSKSLAFSGIKIPYVAQEHKNGTIRLIA